jgi:hypothetical protein
MQNRTGLCGCGRVAIAAVLVMQSGAIAAEPLYHFVDERGVPHFSNHPLDPRYRPIGAAQQAQPEPAAEPAREVTIAAPDRAALGELFEVTLSLANPPAGRGYLELSFDAEVISLQAISADATQTEPGKVRVEVTLDPSQAAQALVNLSFQAIAPAPTQAGLQITQVELVDAKGEALVAQSGASASVTLVQ